MPNRVSHEFFELEFTSGGLGGAKSGRIKKMGEYLNSVLSITNHIGITGFFEFFRILVHMAGGLWRGEERSLPKSEGVFERSIVWKICKTLYPTVFTIFQIFYPNLRGFSPLQVSRSQVDNSIGIVINIESFVHEIFHKFLHVSRELLRRYRNWAFYEENSTLNFQNFCKLFWLFVQPTSIMSKQAETILP